MTDSNPELAELRLANKRTTEQRPPPDNLRNIQCICFLLLPWQPLQVHGLKQHRFITFTFWRSEVQMETLVLKSSCCQAVLLLRALGWNSFPDVFKLLQAAMSLDSNPPIFQASRHVSPTSASESHRPWLWPFCLALSLIRTLVVTWGPPG